MTTATDDIDLAKDAPPDASRPSVAARVLMLPIRAWRLLSVHLPPRCRFHPSCSQYSLEALSLHGAWRGGMLAARRVVRCHPWHAGGLDPVPQAPSHTNTRSQRDDRRSGAVTARVAVPAEEI